MYYIDKSIIYIVLYVIYIYFRKCNFLMNPHTSVCLCDFTANPHVRLLDGWSVGRLIG